MSLVVPKSKKGLGKNTAHTMTLDARFKEKLASFDGKNPEVEKLEKQLRQKKRRLKACANSMDEGAVLLEMTLRNEVLVLEKELRQARKHHDKHRFLRKSAGIMQDYYAQQQNGGLLVDINDGSVSTGEATTRTNKQLLDEFVHGEGAEEAATCEHCGEVLREVRDRNMYMCHGCGWSKKVMITDDTPDYNEVTVETGYVKYRRINHIREWISQFQGRTKTQIDEDVYDRILVELKKERITNLAELTPAKMRKILRRLRLNKYYEHIPQIISQLTGLPPPKITKEIENKLCEMFQQIQAPFQECNTGRKNFLSYSYVLHKLTQLLELHEFQHSFNLLKSRQKLREQDRIWKFICEKLGWTFYPSA